MSTRRLSIRPVLFFSITLLSIALVLGIASSSGGQESAGGEGDDGQQASTLDAGPGASPESAGRSAADYGLGESHVSRLRPYPTLRAGERSPFDLWRYGGRAGSSTGRPVLPMPFDEWLSFNRDRKPTLMAEVHDYMASRYVLDGEAIEGAWMSGGRKPIMKGPVARLPDGIGSWEELAALTSDEIRERELFPYVPLAHPLQTTAHMVFPESWLAVHPEHRRIDVDHDFPDAYLPESPPPMFLSTHRELGDVTGGQEVTLDNFWEIFDGLLTPEQLEGLRELLEPTATTWFNKTSHRVTEQPNDGVSCFSCHVNGHTNGAFELAPDSRPNLARLRVDTPSMRGNYNAMQLSSKRSIRSLDHFSEVEEYFDGDAGGLGQPIGLASRQRAVTNRMGDFNALLDYPPAPKLGPLMKLIPEKASASELRGEELFHGKAQCSTCHYGPSFTDDYLHDLRTERFYKGRPEGPIKTFALRNIKDSPPYLHDGRLPTLHDTVEFFNLVLELELDRQEKEDLVAYLLCL